MPRIPVHTVDSAPQASRENLAALQAQFGKVLNIHGHMAHAPAVLGAYVGILEAAQAHSTLSPAEREAIALVVGAYDRCDYCQAAHTGGAVAAGLSKDQTVAVRAGTEDDAKLAALLTVTRDALANVGHVKDTSWQAGLDAGYTDEQLTEVSLFVALNVFTNYFNHLVGTELDLPAAPALPA